MPNVLEREAGCNAGHRRPPLPADERASASWPAASRPRALQSDGLDLIGRASRPRRAALAGGPVPPQDLRPGSRRPERRGSALPAWAYLAQQLVNALAPAAIYALLATGYALIYGITGRINLAFGEFTTVGAFAALAGIAARRRMAHRRGAAIACGPRARGRDRRGPGRGAVRRWCSRRCSGAARRRC